MEEKNCALLLEYLRSILYDTPIHTLDPETLDEPFQELGRGMRFLQALVEEMLTYSAELSRGNLSAQAPDRDNFLCTNLKNMHANLKHLTWQARQVAEGDYSQHVSYLGEFSNTFNTMTAQLKEREDTMHQEAETVARRSRSLRSYNELLLKMTANRPEWIFVVDAETHQVVCCNQQSLSDASLEVSPCSFCGRHHPGLEAVFQWSGTDQEVWQLNPTPEEYYQISSYPVEWQERSAYVHAVADVSQQARERDSLSNKAYHDPVTGLYNRMYFEEYMGRMLEAGKPVTLGYLDLDNLKWVNDHLGHQEGDQYLATFIRFLQKNFRSDDLIARIGGDEFCVVLEGELEEVTQRKLEEAREQLASYSTKRYPMSFSYGVYSVREGQELSLNDILREGDRRMYADKRARKRAREA